MSVLCKPNMCAPEGRSSGRTVLLCDPPRAQFCCASPGHEKRSAILPLHTWRRTPPMHRRHSRTVSPEETSSGKRSSRVLSFAAAIVSTGFVLHSSLYAGSKLQRTEVSEYRFRKEVTLDIGELIRSGAVQPASALSIDKPKAGCWLLRTPEGKAKGRKGWYRNLLNARTGVPDLVINPGLKGVYNVYAQVRAVQMADADAKGSSSMAFEIALDDGSKRRTVTAAGFPEYHYDTEVMAGHRWRMDGRKMVIRNVGKPVYVYAFRFVPWPRRMESLASYERTRMSRWLAMDHVTVAKAPSKHLAFPGAAVLKNGDMVVVYREGTVHGVERIGKVSLSRSTDGGRTWLPRVTALDRPNVDDRDPSIHEMSDGMVLLFSPSVMCTSSDFGRTWSQPMPTPVFAPKGAVEDEDGHIVYAGQRLVQRQFTRVGDADGHLRACASYRSKDKGRSWQDVGIATYTLQLKTPSDSLWFLEPFMCVIPNKFYVMCYCNRMKGDGFFRIQQSADRGRTWGPIIKTPVWGKPAHLLPLRDGRLLMSYGYRRPPWGVRACLSSDYGKTWDMDNEIILRMDGGTPDDQERKVGSSDLGYPVSVQLDDGRIFTVYYFNKNGSNCFIAGTFWELPLR